MQQIPTYIINLLRRTDRKTHILKQFKNREEFNIKIVKAVESQLGAIGLWKTITKIIKDLTPKDAEYILICEDDHLFTAKYTKECLFKNIRLAENNGADILLGGVSWLDNAVQISQDLFWVDKFSGLQFTVIFKRFYDVILNAEFNNNDVADHKIATLTDKKFVIYPFISTQKEFGYSDVTVKNDESGWVDSLFAGTSEKLHQLKKVFNFYQPNLVMEEKYDFKEIVISTYVITLKESNDYSKHIQRQFAGRDEFDLQVIYACKHEFSAISQWQNIVKIVKEAKELVEDVIIICKDDHQFSENYSRYFLIRNIIEAHDQGVNIMLGGINDFYYGVQISNDRFWVDRFWESSFIVIYNHFFQQILDEPFSENDVVDLKLSEMTSNKMVIYPFISTQKYFVNSDISSEYNKKSKNAADRLNKMIDIKIRYGVRQ
jgi:GR25 family glycosyltransferase involved in LPS biosynthesis